MFQSGVSGAALPLINVYVKSLSSFCQQQVFAFQPFDIASEHPCGDVGVVFAGKGKGKVRSTEIHRLFRFLPPNEIHPMYVSLHSKIVSVILGLLLADVCSSLYFLLLKHCK